jgi:hypothetical protein
MLAAMDVNETRNRCPKLMILDAIRTSNISYFSFVLIYRIAAVKSKEIQKYLPKSAETSLIDFVLVEWPTPKNISVKIKNIMSEINTTKNKMIFFFIKKI